MQDKPSRRWIGSCAALLVLAAGGCLSRSFALKLDPDAAREVERGVAASADATGEGASPRRYLAHVTLMAHDQLAGRGTGSHGIDLAAGYIAGQFAAAGLEPGGGGTYFQDFNVRRGLKLLVDTRLELADPESPLGLSLRDDYIPFGFSAKGAFEGDVVFAGYGITAPAAGYDDYAGLDVHEKVVLMLRRQPPDFDSQDDIPHANFETKVKLAAKNGAVAVLIVNRDPGEDGIDALMRFRSPGGDYGIPAIHIKRGPAERILAAGGLTAAATTDAESTEESADNRTPTPILTGLQRRIDEDAARVSGPLAGVTLRGHVAYEADEVTGRNVIGVLPGSGPHADEYVVIGAHYDHLGKRRGRVYNGADDNASGSAGVIELAWMLSATPERDRSVLLMTFAGEEIGLLGSRHYASEPTVEIDSITAMLNMDMIGRLSDAKANMLAIQGLGTGDAFKQIVARRTEEAGLKYLPDESSHGPSDHASFDRVGVPSLFFFTGVHEDYHQPGDDVEKINVEGAVRIVDLVRDIALDLINLDTAPQFAEVTSRPDIFRGAGPSRAGGVVMGIMPDMDDESDAPGWRVARVFPASGADKAGMKNGDRILRIEGRAINGFSDYSEVTRGKKPGDRLAVIVLRGGKELTLSVELSARGG